MIYIFAGYVVASGLIMGYLIWSILEMHWRGVKERQQLEDRLMAVCQPVPLTTFKAMEDPTPAKVQYVDSESQIRIGVPDGGET